MTDVINLPVIPLREAVLFPEVTSPIAAGRPGTLRAFQEHPLTATATPHAAGADNAARRPISADGRCGGARREV